MNRLIRTAGLLAVGWLRERPFGTLLEVLLLAFGVGTLVALTVLVSALDQRLQLDSKGIDLVVGAKGSPLQLVLSSVYQLDAPTGNVALHDAITATTSPWVKRAVPITLGDSWRGQRIVGTTPAYFELYGASLAEGRWPSEVGEVVVGAAVRPRVALGEHLHASHGLAEAPGTAPHALRVVGVLAPTGRVVDRVLVTSLETTWALHNSPSRETAEITALLVTYASPLAAATFPRHLQRSTALQAASPPVEVARVFVLLAPALAVLRTFGMVALVGAALVVFAGLMQSNQTRIPELVLLRVLGAAPAFLFATTLLTAVVTGSAGGILGALFGWLVVMLLSLVPPGAPLIPGVWPTIPTTAGWLVLAAPLLAGFAALVPAWRAARQSALATR